VAITTRALYLAPASVASFLLPLGAFAPHVVVRKNRCSLMLEFPVAPTRRVCRILPARGRRRIDRDSREGLSQWLRRGLWLVAVWGSFRGSGCPVVHLGQSQASATQMLGLEGTGRSCSGVNPTKCFVTGQPAATPSRQCSNLAVLLLHQFVGLPNTSARRSTVAMGRSPTTHALIRLAAGLLQRLRNVDCS
jgi:hypothetical protein